MRHLGKIALLIAVLGLGCAALILFGARLGLWQPITGFGLYRNYFNTLAMIVAAVGLIALVVHLLRRERGGMLAGGIATIVGLALLAPMAMSMLNPAPRAAPIHDITTDTANPPMFEVLDETREGASNTLDYGGPELAEAQAAAYPDIAPLDTDLPADAAFARALEVAEEMGWEIVASDADRLRFEAVARTSVFHFADDVVVVVTALDGGSRVDMRGVSRVGRSDQGVNAARIRDFQQRVGA
ncbi:DUF1499 domain-containing protein [Paracoccus sp. 1_MG-2023]|uniref:DUF1499 domain-containing protein n=1 Tax=unclassified Paracoccus (in: a-proteobacteria) TaxID=2688777 RepID=UPI001C0872E2|nr:MULTISPECIES: DUF1499 domain-containing protein [unclassified Paracoccus (in: a-proteobacteria)]MBU2959192.1 DUF1499 domain-containing protein [Paracoccus sp. C2R09]MDO6670071.1 DUF1499 domain-containing protein [Paracoccus sp. 1_MG-2023]